MNAIAPTLDYGSVCSGIEAATVAWRPLGLRAAWYSEIAPFPSAVLAHHYPHTPNLGDLTLIADRVLSGDVRAPDVLVGGTPCQSFSVAGMRQGLADARGALTLTYAELANAIDQVRATEHKPSTILVWENVPGVLSDRANAFGCFLGAISGEERALQPPGHAWTHAGCVYGPQRSVAWRVLDAQYFGLAQRRQRVFVVASARTDVDPAAILFEHGGVRRDSSPRETARQDASTASAHCAAGEGIAAQGSSHGTSDDTSVPIACFGGGNTAGAITRAACLTARGHKCDFEVETFAVQGFSGALSHALNTANNGKGSSEDGSGRGVPIVGIAQPKATSQHPVHARGYVTHPLTCAHSVTEDGNGRGVPIIGAHYQLYGLAWPINDAATAAFAQNSRGEIRWEGGDGERIGALSAGGGIPGQGVPTVASAHTDVELEQMSLEAHFECRPSTDKQWWQQWHVRRLMPMECERLQGFPDHYTLVPYRGRLAADGPRYAAIGNSMAVPCVAWIGRRLVDAVTQAKPI